MISFLKKIKHHVIFAVLWIGAFWKVKKYGNNNIIFLLGTPWHGNIGDQAIALAEDKFLADNCKKKIVEIPSQYLLWYLTQWINLIGNSSILIHGGGFIGTLWPEEDKMIRSVIASFKENKIVILPQTIYFDEKCCYDTSSYTFLFSQCTDITICVREQYSYNVCKKKGFPNIYLMPDMVTYLQSSYFGGTGDYEKDKVLLCFRNDKEKAFDSSALNQFFEVFQNIYFEFTDTFVNHTIYPFNRKKEIEKKIREFRSANVVITDRLHGMVLAALAGTPCIVFGNCNYKIIGVYEWVSNNRNIRYLAGFESFFVDFEQLLKAQHIAFNNDKTKEKFAELKTIVEGL